MRVQIVSFRCVLKNQLGEFISASTNQDVVAAAENAAQTQFPALATSLQKLKVGERSRFKVPADQAYGFYLPELVVRVPRSALSKGRTLKLGDEIHGMIPNEWVRRKFRVIEASPDTVVLDANHPLAGQDLVFDVELTSSRVENDEDPTATEQLQSRVGLLN